MTLFLIIAMCVFAYAIIASIVGQTGYKISYNKCGAYSHSECEHWGWYWLGTFWPISIGAAIIYIIGYCLLAGPLKIGDWFSSAATNWKVFQ